ncbi:MULTISPECIES: hypothetical protein [Vibrio]|jgi:hypothetical protein|uniref:Uncharacterized protein n=1 Tax=Vibrio harveyi TaxID=669 RepID=A0A1E3EAW3_VIBHA|nr:MULTISPECIES: hypothetical protein [Vibrio]AIV07662.1 hypothetical protein LA59_19655 [Vibrio harveyi]AMF99536.1 hypothetical protein AL538_17555 [Vibrio harveyi]APP07159.1 hypothetical protein BG259_17850 [Vibrio harveyi]AWB01197.1 hypothetical protein CU052_18105 [Vibrio harveyi]EKO3784543.1 hypothetical protein [Vibrio harveyi]
MEELVTVVLRAIVRSIIIEIFLWRLSYCTGYIGLSIITLGKRPHKPMSKAMRIRISYFGIFLLVVFLVFMF